MTSYRSTASHRLFGKSIACVVALVVSGLVSGSIATAEVVFGNLGATGTAALSSTNTDFGPTDGTRALAQGFTTGSSNDYLTLQSITLGLFDNTSPDLRTVSIYSNNAGSPGTSLFTSSSQAVTTTNKYTFTFANPKLNANTTYWIVPGGPASWYVENGFTNPTEQNGSGYAFVGTRLSTVGTGGPWTSSGLTSYSVSIQAVPEPSTYAMAAIGAGVAGLMGWRRRKVAADTAAVV
jgi:hypothetical protein